MASHSKIEWTEQTWNPIVGCSVLSPGCTNCYAMKQAHRIEAMTRELVHQGKAGAPQYLGTTKVANGKPVWTGRLAMADEPALLAPLKRRKPTTYFVNSMGDLFHEDCPDEWIDRVFAVMALAPQHTFQVLTKRAVRMREYVLSARDRIIKVTAGGNENVGVHTSKAYHSTTHLGGKVQWPLPNVWLGTSVEDQARADIRREPMSAIAKMGWLAWVSYEPALGPVDWTGWEFLRWIVSGGESGPGARSSHSDWHRAARDFCASHGIAYFFKQWGSNIPDEEREGRYRRVPKKIAGRMLDGVEHNGMPEARR